MMSSPSYEADPLKRLHIRRFAYLMRNEFGISDVEYIDLESFLEFELPKKMNDFKLDIMPSSDMGKTHAFAKPDNGYMCVRDDVFEGACNGNGQHRGTVFHELGHIFLHTTNRMRYLRSGGKLKAYNDPEWQAKAFAGEFLVPAHLVYEDYSARKIAYTFGVSLSSAKYQLQQYIKDGAIKKRSDQRSDLLAI